MDVVTLTYFIVVVLIDVMKAFQCFLLALIQV